MSFNRHGYTKEGAFEEKLEAMLGKWEVEWGLMESLLPANAPGSTWAT